MTVILEYLLVYVLAVDAAAEQGRQRGPLPAAGAQRVGPAAKRSRVQVFYKFGREDTATREALERLAASVARHLEPGEGRAIAAEGLEFAESRPLGGT